MFSFTSSLFLLCLCAVNALPSSNRSDSENSNVQVLKKLPNPQPVEIINDIEQSSIGGIGQSTAPESIKIKELQLGPILIEGPVGIPVGPTGPLKPKGPKDEDVGKPKSTEKASIIMYINSLRIDKLDVRV